MSGGQKRRNGCTRAEEAQRGNTTWQESLRFGSALVVFPLQEQEARIYNEVEQALERVYGMELDNGGGWGLVVPKGFGLGKCKTRA